jgi:hypothetical protein
MSATRSSVIAAEAQWRWRGERSEPVRLLAGWAYRTRTGESARELSDWIYVTTSPAVGAGPAAETIRVQAARYSFAVPALGRSGVDGRCDARGGAHLMKRLPPRQWGE